MTQLLSSRVVVEEQEPQVRAIEGVPTDRAAFVGVTERGPVDEAVLVQNFEEFRRIFGTFTLNSELPLAVEGFFSEGGTFAYVVRVVHHTDVTDPATKTSVAGLLDLLTPATTPTSGTVLGSVVGPFDLEPGDSLTIDVDGGGAVIPASATVPTSNTETFALSDGQDLTVVVNGGATQTVTFLTADFANIAAATAAEVAAVITANLVGASAAPSAGAVVITTDWQGFDVTVQVTGGTANPALAFPTTLQSGAGAVVNAAAAFVTTSNTETFGLSDGQDLDVQVDGGSTQNIVFLAAEFANIAAATAAEVVDVINAKISGAFVTESTGAVTITSDTRGTSSSVQVIGGTANAVLGFSTTLQSGTGNVADIDAVTVSEVETIVEGAVAGLDVINDSGRVRITSDTTGASSSIQISASDMQVSLGLSTATASGGTGAAVATLRVNARYDGTYSSEVTVRVSAASNGDATQFNLQLIEDGIARSRETFSNLSMDATDSRYAPTIVNADPAAGGSEIVLLEDLLVGTPDPIPDVGTFGPLAGGDDGLVGLADSDFIGGTSNSGRTGIRVLDLVLDVAVLSVPGQATALVHNAMITYCEITREGAIFAVLDPPANLTAAAMKTYVIDTAVLRGLSEFGAIYWPRIRRPNPSIGVYGDVDDVVQAPSGHIAGVYARSDQRRAGVFKVPANVVNGRLRSVVGVETDQVKDREARDLLYPELVNLINIPTTSPKIPYLDGARTLRADGPFPIISQRRATIFIEQSLIRSLDPLRYENITASLRRAVGREIKAFLNPLLPDNAFASQVADEAFTIDVSEQLNPPSSIAQRRLIVALGLALNEPAEFIILRVGRDQRALLAELGLEV